MNITAATIHAVAGMWLAIGVITFTAALLARVTAAAVRTYYSITEPRRVARALAARGITPPVKQPPPDTSHNVTP